MAMSYNYILMSMTNGFNCVFRAMPLEIWFNRHDFSKMLYGQGLLYFYDVYISQLIRFARFCSNVDDFNNKNLFLTAKLLKQGYRYNKIRKAFSKFYHRHSELIVKYNIGLKTLLQQGINSYILWWFSL